MYGTLELVVMGLITLAIMMGSISTLITIDKRREYLRVGKGLRMAAGQIAIICYLLWFGYLGRTMDHVGELMTILTWVTVVWKLFAFMRYLAAIENPRTATIRSSSEIVVDTISMLVQTFGISLMFGLALAYGS
jgi:hypothetical protein